MNSDTNLAAWMIAGGQLPPTPSVDRDRAHRFALATTRRTLAGPSLSSRISAALAGLRATRSDDIPACCPA